MRTSSTKFQPLNGSRPSSLTINKYSHLIRKKPSSSSSTSHLALTQDKNPIVIYTKSPKIIHTEPRDFMALVQRLTGMSNSNELLFDDAMSSQNSGSLTSDGSNKLQGNDEQQGEEDLGDGQSCVKEEPFVHSDMEFSDLPIFTPNYVYKFAGSPFGFLGTLLSPSGMEFMKELPEY